MSEKRNNSRISSIHLFNYVHLDVENSDPETQGMGRTINVSETGIMLETHIPFAESNTVDVVVGLKEDMVTICGKVIFCNAVEEGKYRSGIEFSAVDDDSKKILKHYIDAFNALPGKKDA